MKKSLYTLMAAVAFSWQANAQFAIMAGELKGTPLISQNYAGIEGSPYLFDDWIVGKVKLANGTIYPNIPLKYEVLAGQLTFRGKDEKPYLFLHRVAEFALITEHYPFRNGFPAVDKGSTETFYQVLADGEVLLLKRPYKSFTESTPYGQTQGLRIILSTNLYYIQKGGKMYKVKRDLKALQGILTNQPISEYIRTNGLNINSDPDLIQVINHYNGKN
ncbi:MAG TPA: hypothetical protein VEV16_06550 [Daejeonella sp.]|nr:hypothetical protein [Daejeonella sp.]